MSVCRPAVRSDRFLILSLVVIPPAIAGLILLSTEITLVRSAMGRLTGNRSLVEKLKTLAISVYDTGQITANSLLVLFDRQEPSPASSLKTLFLRVQPGSLQKMAADLPDSAKARFYPGWLRYPDGIWRQVEYRFRGRNLWHWDPDKPSLRIKLRKQDPLDRLRTFNLVNPEDRPMIANPMGEAVAQRLGVLTPRTTFVRLFINQEYRGVYHQTTHEDEWWLRREGRMPGPIFVGDHLQAQWQAKDFEVKGDPAVLQTLNPLQRMIEAMDMPLGPQRYHRLWAILSMDRYARWHAAMSLAGSTHTDYTHNNLFYFDPSTGLIEPVISDINGHGMLLFPVGKARLLQPLKPDDRLPLNERLQPLLNVALRDPRFRHRRNEVLYEALTRTLSPAVQRQILDGYFQAMDRDVYADHRKGALLELSMGWWRVPYSNRQYEQGKRIVVDWIARRTQFLLGELGRTAVTVRLADADRSGAIYLVVDVDGHAAARFHPERVPGAVFADRALDGRCSSRLSTPLVLSPGLREDHTFTYPYATGRRSPPYYLLPAPQRYLFKVSGLDVDRAAAAFAGAFEQALTGGSLEPTIERHALIAPAAVAFNEATVHPWQFPDPPTEDVVLGPGDVELRETLEIAATQQLIVRPGTRLRLGKGVSILSQGVVRLVGSAAKPIVLERLEPSEAWGALVLQGPSASGSRIAFARISGGSLTRQTTANILGMVSVHWADDVAITNSVMTSNTLSDDTLHLVHGRRFHLEDLELSRCYGDCLDVDYGQGTIQRVQIQHAGNDGIDLMESRVTLRTLRISRAGDKGISCGEASEADVDEVTVEQSPTGIAVKDHSRLRLQRGTFVQNVVALDLFEKHLVYGDPGTVEVSDTIFLQNEVDLKAEEGSTVVFHQPLPDKRSGPGVVMHPN